MHRNVAPLLVASLLLPMLGAQQKSEASGDRMARVDAVNARFDYLKAKDKDRYAALIAKLGLRR